MAAKKPTPTEVSESLTGFDEIAIKQKFGVPIRKLAEEDQTQFLRALVFTLFRRDGQADPAAHHAAQSLTLTEVTEKFMIPKTKAQKADADFDEQPPTTTP
jgi:hypothetical protein